MKKLNRSILAFLAISGFITLNAENLKISTAEVGNIKISNDMPTTLNFNFLVKTVKPILKEEDSVIVTLLDRGVVIAPNQDKSDGVLVVTNEKGDSYSIQFSTVNPSETKVDKIFNFTDLSYSKEDGIDFDFESSGVEQDVTSIVKALDNNAQLSGFESVTVPYSISNNEFKMDRLIRYTGNKYVVEKWVFTNTSKNNLFFENRDFASEGIIAVSISPEDVAPGESAVGYFVINKATVLNVENQD